MSSDMRISLLWIDADTEANTARIAAIVRTPSDPVLQGGQHGEYLYEHFPELVKQRKLWSVDTLRNPEEDMLLLNHLRKLDEKYGEKLPNLLQLSKEGAQIKHCLYEAKLPHSSDTQFSRWHNPLLIEVPSPKEMGVYTLRSVLKDMHGRRLVTLRIFPGSTQLVIHLAKALQGRSTALHSADLLFYFTLKLPPL